MKRSVKASPSPKTKMVFIINIVELTLKAEQSVLLLDTLSSQQEQAVSHTHPTYNGFTFDKVNVLVNTNIHLTQNLI